MALFHPAGLRRAAYRHFVQMLRAAMHLAGVVRIDHIIGMQRSFWAPENGAPGGYVANPLEPLLALIRLEAWRAGCVAVGEDLGSVRSEEHTSELQSLMRISYAVFCLKKKKKINRTTRK